MALYMAKTTIKYVATIWNTATHKHQKYAQVSLEGLRDVSVALRSISRTYLILGALYGTHYFLAVTLQGQQDQ